MIPVFFIRAIYLFAVILRNSKFKGNPDFYSLQRLAYNSKSDDQFGY
jgi:hypothetical protein